MHCQFTNYATLRIRKAIHAKQTTGFFKADYSIQVGDQDLILSDSVTLALQFQFKLCAIEAEKQGIAPQPVQVCQRGGFIRYLAVRFWHYCQNKETCREYNRKISQQVRTMFFHAASTKLNIYTKAGGRKFRIQPKIFMALAGMLLLLMHSQMLLAQKGLEVPVKLEVDKGSADNIHLVVMKNGKESFTQNISKSAKLKLEFNQTYTLAFSKDGFVTKTIEVNTTAPAERIRQGFEPYKIGIKLFEQQDGNTVMYNQPVGKIRFEESLDDFNYETDYSKSILSAFDSGTKKDTLNKEKKTEQTAETKPAKEKKKKEQTGTDEKQEQDVITASVTENKTENTDVKADLKLSREAAAGSTPEKSAAGASGSSDRERSKGAAGADQPQPYRNIYQGTDAPEPEAVIAEDIKITKEEITEKNRIIIKIKVSSSTRETQYSVVQYNWGGRYFFKETTSINETLFTHWTGVRL